MDSWKYTNMSGEKNVWLSEEVEYPVEGHNCKSKLTGCEIKPPILNVESYPLISNTQALDRLDFMDLGFADDIRKSYSISSEPSGEVFGDEIGTDYNPQLVGEERESTDFMQSNNNNQDFSLVDLKLGNLPNCGISRNSELSKSDVPESSSSMMVSSQGKKARSTNFGVRSPCCQVLGCNKDLGSFKIYYKRHKVCDVHTKTPKVIVDGMEQRFCQQCSRFHLLNEFDDIKRSCRRRLAAHNKRRRRPQLTSESGSGMIDFSSSLTFPEGIPNNVLLGSSKYQGCEQDSIKISNFHLQPKTDNIPTNNNTNSNIFGSNKPVFENPPNIQQTSCALSLLSARSLETTSTNNNGSHANYSIISQQGGPHPSVGISADVEGSHHSTLLNYSSLGGSSDSNNGVSSSLRGNNEFVNHMKGRGIILDLLQLSSHLERVEHQKNTSENEAG